jgi:predicted small lipoprotein YifL
MQTIAIASVLVLGILAVALAGCGRKGPLDAPPNAAINQSSVTAANEVPLTDATGLPVAPTGKKKRLPMDSILD